MKKILTLFLTLVLILSFQQNSQAYQGKWKQAIWAYDCDLYQFDYVELYKIFDKYKNKKNSIDDCIIAGIKFLKENEKEITNKPYDSKEALKIQHHSPMKFMAFVYANYTKLSPAALKELQSSLWDLTPYLNRSFTSREIELLTSVEKTINFTVKGKNIKRRDLIDAFQKLVDNGYMTKAEAAVHMILIMNIVFYHPDALPVKYNIPFNDFWQDAPNITSWIKENEKEIEADQKAFRAIQMLLSNFGSELIRCIENMKTGFLMKEENLNIKENEFFIVEQIYPVIYPPNPPFPPVPKYFEEVFKIAEKLKDYHDNFKFEDVRKPIAWERGGGVYKNKLYIKIGIITNGAAGNAELIYDKNGYPVSAQITLNGESMNPNSNGEWLLPTVFHEYFHTCQYSYTAKDKVDNWYSNGSTEEIRFAMEGTVTLMTDIAINIHSKENPSYVAPK